MSDEPRPAEPSAPAGGPPSQTDDSHKHIGTAHLLKNIGHRAVTGGFVTAAAQGVKFVLNIGSAVVLARMLSPKDFGLVAMAGALMPILRTFREGGLSTATVQKQDITHAQVSNLFWINVAMGTLITAIGAGLAPAVSWFYHDERLTVVTVLLSLSFAISGAAVQHLALLNRQMRFAAVAGIDIASATGGFVVGVAMAHFGASYWSLVGMQLSTTVLELLLTWAVSGWRPQLPRRNSGTKPLLTFGASMTVYILLRRLAASTDVILLGRFYGAEPVGLYSRGQALLLRPLDQFISPFDTVFIPLLSRLQDQPERYRQVFIQAYGAIALLSFTFAGLLFGLSSPLVLLLLGKNWSAVIPVFSWLTIAALYIPLSYAAMWLLTTQARSRDLLLVGSVVPLLAVVSVAIGLPFGVTGIALSLSLVGLFLRLPIQYHITGRAGPVSRGDLWGVFFRHLPIWAAVAAVTWAVQRGLSERPVILQLAVGGTAGALVSVATIALWPSLRGEAKFILDRMGQFLRRNQQGGTSP